MDMIEVDPKLFVMCRLCLEHSGQFQIVPSVQQQIKYCFDIEVEPFDGLPQLICSKCKEILKEFNTIKTTFCEKQSNLRIGVLNKDDILVQPQQDTVSSSQQAPEIKEDLNKRKSKKKRLSQPFVSDLESEQSFHTSKSKKKKSLTHPVESPWQAGYLKHVVCKLCNSVWTNKRSFWNHSRSHELLKERYKNIFNRQCTVNLNKIDDKPNITGLWNMVVHNSNKIIAPGNSYFHTVYTRDGDPVDNCNIEDPFDNIESKHIYNTIQDSTDDEEIVLKRNTKQRKRRLLSKSSNETVVIASNSNKILSDYEEDSKVLAQENIDTRLSTDQCINIDDSSDSESNQGNLESNLRVKQPMEAKLGDYKIIQGIISMCVNSYHKKKESAEVDMLFMNVNQNKKKDSAQISNESHLKHKVLSIGRKIINKQGFNCTGLLRYMEQKNLEIVWMTRAVPSCNTKETNYIRILTKLRGPENIDENRGWVTMSKIPQCNSFNSVPVIQFIQGDVPQQSLSPVPHHSKHDTTIQFANTETGLERVEDQTEIDTTPAILYFDTKSSSNELKKILNANPVANPKQLPKKLAQSSESRHNKTIVQQGVRNDDDVHENFSMPVITSTTSLAVAPTTEPKQNSDKNDSLPSKVITNTESPAPRIKVKPVSELMSERTLNNLMIEQSAPVSNTNMLVSQIDNVWPNQHAMKVFVPNIAPQITSPQLQIVSVPTYQVMPGSIETNINQECIILDTADFPNAKTVSPFKYFRDLLQMHGIFLIDPFEDLATEYKCLIRFRVVFTQQESNANRPVVLCLSLFCLRNNFSLEVRAKDGEYIDVHKLSANWQWEILQIYRGEYVVNKGIQNARKIGQETYNLTNKFFCMLKSINCRKP